jgi:ribosomal protein S18 acetylase RimI-like enzyme
LVRRRREDDLSGLVELLEETNDKRGYPANLPAEPASWLRGPKVKAAFVAVAEDGLLLGHVSRQSAEGHAASQVFTEALSLPEERLAVIRRLFVRPGFEGRGIGRRLLGAAVDDARQLGLVPVLDVAASADRPNGLYRRAGWRFIGERRQERPNGDMLVLNCYAAPAAGQPPEKS